MKYALFDAHCHVDPAWAPVSRPAPAATVVSGRLLCGASPGGWAGVAAAAAGWPGSVPAYGLHPWWVGEADADWLAILEARLAADASAWLGEAGLDRLNPDAAPMARQLAAFREQLRLARRLDRPVNLHCVKAWDEFLALLDTEYLEPGRPRRFIVHSFGGPHQFVRPLAERGAYFTVGPLFSRRDSPRRRTRAALLPIDRLLLESDAFVTPGEDATDDLEHALHWLSLIRETSPERLAEAIGTNVGRLLEP